MPLLAPALFLAAIVALRLFDRSRSARTRAPSVECVGAPGDAQPPSPAAPGAPLPDLNGVQRGSFFDRLGRAHATGTTSPECRLVILGRERPKRRHPSWPKDAA